MCLWVILLVIGVGVMRLLGEGVLGLEVWLLSLLLSLSLDQGIPPFCLAFLWESFALRASFFPIFECAGRGRAVNSFFVLEV